MFMTDGTRIPGSVNLAKWLEVNHYSIEDNIVVVPIALIKNGGKGLFEKGSSWKEDQGVPSPYYGFLYDFIMAFGRKLDDLGIIHESRNIDGIYKYTAEINTKIFDGKFLITVAADTLRSGHQFTIGQDTFNKWFILTKQKIEADSSLSTNQKSDALLEIASLFDNLYRIFGYASLNTYYRTASHTLEEIALLLYHEGVLDQPVINKLTEILGYQGGAHSFLDILDNGKRTSPHKPALIEEKLLTNSKNYLAIYYNHEGLRGDSLTQKVEEVSNKIQDVVKPYYDGAWNYWNSENNLLGDPDEGGVRESAKRNVLSEILHTGGHQLE